MVGSRRLPLASDDDSYLRKIRKPQVEKKRRDRMNRSIEQLKLMIADSISDPIASRMDKADILDLTVSHIQGIKKQQTSVTMATEAAAYNTGFKDCARETIQFLSSAGVISPEALGHLNNNLRSVFEKKMKNPPTVSMATEKSRPESAISPVMSSVPPQHYSTPVPGTSLQNGGRTTPVLGTSHLLDGSAISAVDSSYSCRDSGLSGVECSGLDLSQSSFRLSGVGCSGLDLSQSSFRLSGTSMDLSSMVSGYNSGLDSIVTEEEPWRPW